MGRLAAAREGCCTSVGGLVRTWRPASRASQVSGFFFSGLACFHERMGLGHDALAAGEAKTMCPECAYVLAQVGSVNLINRAPRTPNGHETPGTNHTGQSDRHLAGLAATEMRQ